MVEAAPTPRPLQRPSRHTSRSFTPPSVTLANDTTSTRTLGRKASFGILSSFGLANTSFGDRSSSKGVFARKASVSSPHGFVSPPNAAPASSCGSSIAGSITSTRRLDREIQDSQRRLSHKSSNPSLFTTNNNTTTMTMEDYETPDTSMTSNFSIPTPFANTKYTTVKPSARKSSLSILSRSKSAFFNPAATSPPKQHKSKTLEDESTYCYLSDEGMEVLATTKDEHSGKKLKRSGSLSNMLKTPSRLTLRKSTSKLKLFTDTPSSTSSARTQSTPFDTPSLPPLPSSVPVPAIPGTDLPPLPDATTPASTKSTKSRKSLFARAVLRDKTKVTVNRANAEHAIPGTVATQVQRFQTMNGKESEKKEKEKPVEQPVPIIEPSKVEKTPKHNWLGKLHIGRSTNKKKVRLEIPSFESPSLGEKVEQELKRRSQILDPIVVVTQEPTPPLATPVIETAPALGHLKPALAPVCTVTPDRLRPDAPRPHSGYFPTQAVVASSPMSGDLHLGCSPARSPAHLALKASQRDDTANFSIFTYEEKSKMSERPKSDPMPLLKNVTGATEALKCLLDDFEDTFNYESESARTSAAPTSRSCKTSDSCSFNSKGNNTGSDVPDDLQDLIDCVLNYEEDSTAMLSDASSFEGNASTAHEAIALSTEHPPMPEEAVALVDHFIRASIDNDTERPSIETERQSFGDTERPTFDTARPSFDSGRSSFDYGEEHFKSALADISLEPEKSYYKHRRNVSSQGGASNRSSLRDYLSMERPGLGDRMLQEVDEDVVLEPMSHLRQSFHSDYTDRLSVSGGAAKFQTARTSRSSFGSSSESDGMSYVGSPTPANGPRLTINRHSVDVDVGNSTRPSLELDSDSARPSMESDASRPSFDSVRPLSPVQRQVQQKQNQLVKQSTASSMLSMSSVNSSPCPRPPRRKLLMLTGNRLPRGPIAAPVFQQTTNSLDPSPAQGRVRKLKDSWEAKLSPKKDASPLSSGSSPRYVRPLPSTLGGKLEIVRPRPLSSLSLNGAYMPPDTPPPSSPSASEQSFSSGNRSSVEPSRSYLQSRLANFGRKKGGHRRQSSQLSRSSILAEPIPEETSRYMAESSISTIEIEIEITPAIAEEEVSPISSPEQPKPLVISKKRNEISSSSSSRLSMGMDAFQMARQPEAQALIKPRLQAAITIVDEDRDWEEIKSGQQIQWNKFCQEAVAELQKSRALWPDTEASMEILDSPMTSFSSVSLNSQILTPGSPLLTSPAHQSAIVGFLLDSQARYRSEAARYDISSGSPDVPNTPELSPDSSGEMAARNRRASDVTPPSPTPQPRMVSSKPAYQPRSLLLVEKHLSNTTNIMAPALVKPAAQKSTKGYKPRIVRSPAKTAAVLKPLSPARKVLAVANKRTMNIYSDEAAALAVSAMTRKQNTNSFLGGRALSTRRRDAFTAARRKLEGVGSPEEQTDRSSGTSSNDENGESAVLEARGSVDAVDQPALTASRARPRPQMRRTTSGVVRPMRC